MIHRSNKLPGSTKGLSNVSRITCRTVSVYRRRDGMRSRRSVRCMRMFARRSRTHRAPVSQSIAPFGVRFTATTETSSCLPTGAPLRASTATDSKSRGAPDEQRRVQADSRPNPDSIHLADKRGVNEKCNDCGVVHEQSSD